MNRVARRVNKTQKYKYTSGDWESTSRTTKLKLKGLEAVGHMPSMLTCDRHRKLIAASVMSLKLKVTKRDAQNWKC